MDTKAVVFALVIGWLTGSQPLTPSLLDWLTAREVVGRKAQPISCSLEGTEFVIRQVLLDERTTLNEQGDGMAAVP